MQREIKFRVWDKEKKEWFDTGKQSEYVLALKDKCNLVYCDIEGIGFLNDGLALLDECGNFEYLDPERFELTWYTGLFDKNKKEIYEGDLVYLYDIIWDDVKDTEKKRKRMFEVYWRVDGWHLKDKNGEQYDNGYTYDDWDDIVRWKELKVIGNIYENPELLKDTK